jgi:hypothetical protein
VGEPSISTYIELRTDRIADCQLITRSNGRPGERLRQAVHAAYMREREFHSGPLAVCRDAEIEDRNGEL